MAIRDRLNVYFTSDQGEGIRRLACRTGRSSGALIRDAVAFMLRNPDLFVPAASRHTQVVARDEEREPAGVA